MFKSKPLPPVRIGGLMRCCLLSLAKAFVQRKRKPEDKIIKCNYCGSQMRLRNGTWEWDND